MQNIAEFHIIGGIGKIDAAKDVTHISLAANYNRRDGTEWKSDPHWNRVTLFGKLRDCLAKPVRPKDAASAQVGLRLGRKGLIHLRSEGSSLCSY